MYQFILTHHTDLAIDWMGGGGVGGRVGGGTR